VPLPANMGLEGTGKVIEANFQHMMGKRISYIQIGAGTLGSYSLPSPENLD
jgi:hypothetical protein